MNNFVNGGELSVNRKGLVIQWLRAESENEVRLIIKWLLAVTNETGWHLLCLFMTWLLRVQSEAEAIDIMVVER